MPRQQQIPGTERPEHPLVVEAAELYVEARDERMRCTKIEVNMAASLLATMRKHKVKRHKFVDGKGIELEAEIVEPEAKVRVRKTGEADDDAPDVVDVPGGIIEQARQLQGGPDELAEVGTEPNGAAPKKRGRKSKAA